MASLSLLAVLPGAAPPSRVHRLGFVGFYSPGLQAPIITYFREGLSELGYADGRNVSIEFWWADRELGRYRAIAEDMVGRKLDVIVTPCGPIVAAIRALDPTVPLVLRSVDIETCGGEIAIDTLERPGGFSTGTISFSPAATPRRLRLLQELIPGLGSLGLLHRAGSDWTRHVADVEAAAQALGLRVHRAEWKHASDLPGAFATLSGLRVAAILTLGEGLAFFHRQKLFDLAAARRLPVLYDFTMFPAGEELGLISYAVDVRTMFRYVARQVVQILEGTKPGDIPVGRPQRFRLIVNRDAARSLGLSGPLVLRPDPVVEDLAPGQ